MNVNQHRPKSILSLFIAIFFVGFLVHGGIGKPWFFVKGCSPAVGDFSLAAAHAPGSEQARSNASGDRTDVYEHILAIVAGIVGNIIGTGTGIGLGIGLDRIFPVGHDAIVPPGVLLGAPAGSIFGSALGVYLVGNSRNAGGNFGSAVSGSFLGELAAIAIASFVGLGEREGGAVAVLSFAVLPPIGATLGFNSSLPSRSSRAGSGILNLAGGKLGLGVPDFRIRPVFVPGGGNARPGMQFKMNVFSVEL